MSTGVACKVPGLVGAFRSMNVSRKELESWILEASICSTKSPRICAASVPSAVAPACRICDSGRPARYLLLARSGGHARKPLERPSSASMPCAPGWSVWSVARHDGERANRPTCAAPRGTPVASATGRGGMRVSELCKANYAVTVKIIMPHGLGPASRCERGSACICRSCSIVSHTYQPFGLT